ncbi:MAG: DUF308 domain-containing protein [Anaerolineae bacterium]|nr:DUF308 domain-containing protein [Anaerolineae bacterium]
MTLYDKEMNKLMASTWWVVLLRGVFIGIVGLLMLFWTEPTLLIMTIFAGGFLFVSGVWAAVGGFIHRMDNSKWWLDILIGLIGVVAGLLVMLNPLKIAEIAPELMIVILAALTLGSGVLEIYKGIHVRREGHKDGSHIIIGVGYLLTALVLMLMPMLTVGLVVYGFGFFLLFIALVLIWYSFVLRGMSHEAAENGDDSGGFEDLPDEEETE